MSEDWDSELPRLVPFVTCVSHKVTIRDSCTICCQHVLWLLVHHIWWLGCDILYTVSCVTTATFHVSSQTFMNLTPWLLYHTTYLLIATRMWANAQRDGRPAEHRWRLLFNAAKFDWRPLLDCRAVTLPRRDTRWNMMGCPKPANRSQQLVGRSSPYCKDIWRRYCCLTIFPDCRYLP